MNWRGFTIVEIIITITIMGILLVLGTVVLNQAQVQARDDERISDVETLGVHLDKFFQVGLSQSISATIGRYPTTNLTSSKAIMLSTLDGINEKTLMAPGVTDPTQTFKAAQNNDQTTGGVLPQPTTSEYIYQPIRSDGELCTGTVGNEDCRKFNIFYRLEQDNAVHKYESKNQ